MYNLSHKTILNRLTAAENEGVDVQVLIEADQLHKEWNVVAKYFRDAGLEVVYDHNDLTEETRHTADVVGIKEKGLMHLKTRLFSAPGEVTLLTGSLNPTIPQEPTRRISTSSAIPPYCPHTLRRTTPRLRGATC